MSSTGQVAESASEEEIVLGGAGYCFINQEHAMWDSAVVCRSLKRTLYKSSISCPFASFTLLFSFDPLMEKKW